MSDVNRILTSLLLSHAIRRYFWRIVVIEVSYILERIFVSLEERTPNLTICRSISGAPPGTRTLGPLIKRNRRATIINFQNYTNSSFLSFYRKSAFCICCILCTRYPILHPLSSRSGVQKVCKNVQSQNQPLKTGIGFLYKAGKMAAAI